MPLSEAVRLTRPVVLVAPEDPGIDRGLRQESALASKQVDKFSIRRRADAGLARYRLDERAYDSLFRELKGGGRDVSEEILEDRSTGPASRRY